MKDGMFEIGDIVHLRSGSARQTVVGIKRDMTERPIEITTAWVIYATQEVRTFSAHPHAFVLSATQEPV